MRFVRSLAPLSAAHMHTRTHASPPRRRSREALTGWGSFLQLALPSAAMTSIEWWCYELQACASVGCLLGLAVSGWC